MNTFGTIFRLTTFGESHGPAIGGIIDGLPPCLHIDTDALPRAMRRRRPGQSQFTSSRSEADAVEILSGISPEGLTLGSPIGFLIRNNDARSADYAGMERALRPNHADYTYMRRYGIRDHRGGGRASARETACRVAAGAIASQVLATRGVGVRAWLSAVGSEAISPDIPLPTEAAIAASAIFCPDAAASAKMESEIATARAEGDSVGGRVSCSIVGLPAGIGDPVYGKLQMRLASAAMSINAAKAFEYGLGVRAASARGSRSTDLFVEGEGAPRFASNMSGGIQGGISTGEEVRFHVSFKPTPTLLRDVATTDACGRPMLLHARGRHDPCVAVRAVPVVEAMAAIAILDAMLIDLGQSYFAPAGK